MQIIHRLWAWLAACLRSKRDRKIFSFWDGTRWRRVDPLVVFRGLVDHPTYNMETHPLLVETGDDEAYLVMLQATRDVFGIKPLSDDGGLTECETMGVHFAFSDFMVDLKKSISPGLTPQSSTEPVSSPAISESPTSASLDCGSIPPGPSIVVPFPT